MFTEQVYREERERRPIVMSMVEMVVDPRQIVIMTKPPPYHFHLREFRMDPECVPHFRILELSIGNQVIVRGPLSLTLDLYVMAGQDIRVHAENITDEPKAIGLGIIGDALIEPSSVLLVSETCAGCGAALMHLPGKDAICPTCV